MVVFSWCVAVFLAAGLTAPVTAVELAIVRLPGDSGVGLRLAHGLCRSVAGPFDENPSAPGRAGDLHLWSVHQTHFLCMPSSWLGLGGKAEAQLIAAPSPRLGGDGGQFGFGPGVAVNLQPEITTDATWPLQAGIPSLPVKIDKDQAARQMAFSVTQDDEVVTTLPVVVARTRWHDWPVDVQLVDPSLGSCYRQTTEGTSRFVCRLWNGDSAAQIVVFCGACFQSHLSSLLLQGMDGHAEGHTTSRPWLGLSTGRLDEGSSRQWVLTLQRRKEEAEQFEIAAVVGAGEVPWRVAPGAEGNLGASGTVLAQALLPLTIVLCIVAWTLARRGRPAAPAAAVPALSAAAAVLQYLALLSARKDAPGPFHAAFKPLALFVPAEPKMAVCQGVGLLLAISVVHAYVVLQHLRANGDGAAERMPHHLSFGSWQLRWLSFLALPLSYGSTSLLMAAWQGSLHDIVFALLGATVLVTLLALAWGVLWQLGQWFQDSHVICVQQKDGSLQFLDRVCDQISSMPLPHGTSRLLGSWCESPSWNFAPIVASIVEVEHRGLPKERGVNSGSWDRVWPANGPWIPVGTAGRELSISSQSGLLENMDNRSRAESFCSDATGASGAPLIAASRSLSSLQGLYQSPLLGAHPVPVTTRFAYASSGKGCCFAGVAGLPWIDTAVPADTLQSLEEQLGGQVALKAKATQLVGPLTGGRLAACFDSGDRRPWRWPYDLLLKVALGVMVATAPSATAPCEWQAPTSLGQLAETCVLRATSERFDAVILQCTLFVLAVFVFCTLPHVHAVDNLGAAAAAVAVVLGTGLYFRGHELPDSAEHVTIALLGFAYVPIFLALLAAFTSSWRALAWRGSRDDADEVLASIAPGWGEASGTRSSAYQGLGSVSEDEDSTRVRPQPDSAVRSAASADAVLLPPSEVEVMENRGKGLRPKLPCEVRVAVAQTRVWAQGSSAVSAAGPSAESGRPQLALPMSLLFPGVDGDRTGPADVLPLATLLTPEDGVVLYASKENNGNLEWPEALQRFFGDEMPLLSREAEKVLLTHVANQPPGQAPNEGTLAAIEVLKSPSS
eukprot:TRINITY_DN16091_c0_g1_i1.p1 TRINITY_DN16091_c0_g1~~TRINITY_DN16091_c0_g1_i1.p1  ORF type:complete len:1067 (+),score=221.93 TRINITY_DN16091_c0_g1_i1:79-3279(+)